MTTAPLTCLVGPVLRRCGATTLMAGSAVVLVGAATSGGPAAAGGAVGTAMVVAFFVSGVVVLGPVTRLFPAASLIVALLTYGVQVVLVGLTFALLDRTGAVAGPVDARWLAAALVAGTATWLTSHLLVTVRARLPLYDLRSSAPEGSVR